MPGASGPPPPGAVLSADQKQWWNGRAWTPVPQGAMPTSTPHLGLWARHRLHVAEKHYAEQLQEWQAHLDGLNEYLRLIDTFHGTSDADGFVLKRGETMYGTISQTALVETRVGGGHWVSGSSGFSFPVGSIGGHAVRYRVGRTRGHFVQGAPAPTAIDRGTTFITSQRIVFAGGSQTRECAYTKLIGYRHDAGEVTLSVSNRQKPTTIHYGQDLEAWFVERFELALAGFRGTVPQLRATVAGLVDEAEHSRPVDPASVPAAAPAVSPPSPPPQPPPPPPPSPPADGDAR